MKKVNYKGTEYMQVDTINGHPILLKEDYVKTFNIAGVDIEGSPLTTQGYHIIDNATSEIVGYFGVEI